MVRKDAGIEKFKIVRSFIMNGPNVFLQLTKVDEEQRLVYGRAVVETLDKSGEVFDYDSSKPHFKEWSDGMAKVTDGKSLGNIRAMHNKVAAGKVIDIEFHDDAKAIDIVGKIVDDDSWNKVLEGVFSGFSIGGRYHKKWQVPQDDGKSVTKYTAIPSEISLVDVPCVPGANFFEVRKADGSTAQVEFAPAKDTEEKLLKVSLNGKEIEATIAEETAAVGKHITVIDGEDEKEIVITKIADGIAHAAPVVDGVVEPEVAGTEADVLKLQAVMEEHKLTVADVVEMTLAKVAEREVTPLQKIAASLEELAGIGEDHHVATIAKLLHDMVAESDELEKVGARNSAADKKHIQAIHDASHHLGADCAKEEMAEKTAAASTLDKSLQAAFDELTKRVDELSKAATAPKVALRVVPVSKDQDTSAPQNGVTLQPVYDAFGKLDPAATAMKLVHATGGANIIPGKL